MLGKWEKSELLLLFLLSCGALCARGANILGLVTTPQGDNPAWTQPLFEALAARGHSVTVLSTAPVLKNSDITHIPLQNDYDVVKKHFVDEGSGEYRDYWSFRHLQIWYEAMLGSCGSVLEARLLKKPSSHQMQSLQVDFDLVIYDATYAWDCVLHMLLKQRQVPVMGVSGGKLNTELLKVMRASDTINAANIPHFISELPHAMGYWQRVHNHLLYLEEVFLRLAIASPVLRGLLKTDDFHHRVNLMLLNTHPALDYVQNMPPNILEVGGLHIRPHSRELSQSVEVFLEDYSEGVIYISLPRIELFPEMARTAIIDVVASYRNYGIIWNLHNEELKNTIPVEKMTNLHIVQVEPQAQQDILAYSNVKAFITHGDSFSLQEAIYNAIPVVVFPMLHDEINNAQRVKERSLGITIAVKSFSYNSFSLALKRVLFDDHFSDAVHQAKLSFRNRAMSPVEEAVWHAEKLMTEPQIYDALSSPEAHSQNYFVRHSLDVLALPALFILLFIFNVAFLIMQMIAGFKDMRKKKLEHEQLLPKPRGKKSLKEAKYIPLRKQQKHDTHHTRVQKDE
ncbi:UDP-glucuronosyltransferase 1-9 [Scaptodrosophila lebanonensis]|uniref:UDP-glucuronosyltransferase 1-9 n=1 Tax=Drosophila lebanonensis TaxID=7225 RepID=A0A6J2T776_DROLE|nr:UDP-glucuronosyltransferase 1-9 [Scaptodrosophila lebanonensis]